MGEFRDLGEGGPSGRGGLASGWNGVKEFNDYFLSGVREARSEIYKRIAKVRVRRGILGRSLIFHKPEIPYL